MLPRCFRRAGIGTGAEYRGWDLCLLGECLVEQGIGGVVGTPDGPRGMSVRSGLICLAASLGLFVVVFAAGCGSSGNPGPMKIGLMLDFPGSPEASAERKRGFDLALRHFNEGGGVLGRPVEAMTGDPTRGPGQAVEVARRLLEEGVHAIVGPSSSAAALPVVETITGPAGVPTISPSPTSAQLAVAEDNDLFFRTTLSDIA